VDEDAARFACTWNKTCATLFPVDKANTDNARVEASFAGAGTGAGTGADRSSKEREQGRRSALDIATSLSGMDPWHWVTQDDVPSQIDAPRLVC
jgi:hypothetical protein